jgi:hypothetical protein
MSLILTKEYNVMVKSEELIVTTEHLMLYMSCHLSQYHYNRVWLYKDTQKETKTSSKYKELQTVAKHFWYSCLLGSLHQLWMVHSHTL